MTANRTHREARAHRRSTPFAVTCAVACIATSLQAAPFTPADDAQVLERLPSRTTPQFRDLKALQAAARQSPRDLGRATALATAYIRASRVEGDPRFLGYAQAALAPWWSDPQAPTSVLVLRATILQSTHQFGAALVDLDAVLTRDTQNAQARLTRATILTVQGNYAAARVDCDRLSGITPPIYPAICIAAIDSLTGKSAAAYATLHGALRTLPRVDDAGRAWGETLLGEIAHRRGDPVAEAHFRAALAIGDKDAYLLAAYCDWLLDQHRAEDVVALLQNETRVDTLLLRLALAQDALRRPEAAVSIEQLRARFDASHARGDMVHARENARFELVLRHDPKSALAYALEDWKVQREPADLWILAATASAADDAAALATVRRWIAQTGIEYTALTALVDARKAPR
jgi:hypothetical protein